MSKTASAAKVFKRVYTYNHFSLNNLQIIHDKISAEKGTVSKEAGT
ncbi:hypothetical protein MM221_09715 [Salipaludibacillus sp. LMS25]|nr:hypothetical protein [Salipaludibacillus sp. LMS25]UTR16759.1 hypothetical protein MM221_09715 [Salipaludibacillus sp. LMS25]